MKLFWQIFKYGLIGVFATIVNLVVAEFCAAGVWPCLGSDDLLVRGNQYFLQWFGFEFHPVEIAASLRASRAVYCNFAGFMVANIVCWLLNRKFVFEPGRHHWFIEYLLFLSGSGVAIAVGSAVIWVLVCKCGMQTTYSFVINVFASVSINFVVRKFVVFRG